MQSGNGPYNFLSYYYQSCGTPGTINPDPTRCSLNPYGGMDNLRLSTVISYQDGRVHLGEYLTAEINRDTTTGVAQSFTTLRANPVEIQATARLPKNATVHEWRAVNLNEPWYVQLQIQQSDGAPFAPNRWKQCWHVRLPNLLRLACQHFTYVQTELGEYVAGNTGWVIDDGRYGKQSFGTP